jgi:hypothetical protein
MSRKPKPRPKTKFERETERRRKEMIRNLSGTSHTNNISHRRLARLVGLGVQPVIVQNKDGKDVPIYSGPRPNLFRQMARDARRPRMEVRA